MNGKRKIHPEDCPYNDGLPYGIEYYDGDIESVVHVEWFKSEEQRDKRLDNNFMSTEDAFEIVFELAKQTALTEREVKQYIQLKDEYDRQKLALNVVEDFLVNNIYN